MKNKKYVMMGDPMPWARVRLHGKTFFDGQKKSKVIHGIELKNQHGDLPFYRGPVELDICFYFGTPKNLQKKKERLDQHYHVFRPDLSNLIKYIEDVAISILYKDDCVISSIKAKKCYDREPRTEFILRELHGNKKKN